VALRAVTRGPAQLVVGTGDIISDLVVEGAAADIVDLVNDILTIVPVLLAVGCVGSQVKDAATFDAEPLEPGAGMIPSAAEAEGLLGAVLAGRAVAGIQEASETVVAVAFRLTRRTVIGRPAVFALIRVFHYWLGVSWGPDEGQVPFLRRVTPFELGTGNFIPISGSGSGIPSRGRLGEHRDGSCGSEEKPLERHHLV